MLKLESEVHEFAELTIDKMLADAAKGKGAFDIKQAFNCFTGDVISQYCFGESMGFVAQDSWTPNLATWTDAFFKSAYMMRHNTLGRKMASALPFMADYLGEDIRAVFKVMNVTIPGYIAAALKNPENGRVFAEVLGNRGTLSEEEKFRYNGEGFNFLLAGTETTAVRNPISPIPSHQYSNSILITSPSRLS
jgi:cytochrome P450